MLWQQKKSQWVTTKIWFLLHTQLSYLLSERYLSSYAFLVGPLSPMPSTPQGTRTSHPDSSPPCHDVPPSPQVQQLLASSSSGGAPIAHMSPTEQAAANAIASMSSPMPKTGDVGLIVAQTQAREATTKVGTLPMF